MLPIYTFLFKSTIPLLQADSEWSTKGCIKHTTSLKGIILLKCQQWQKTATTTCCYNFLVMLYKNIDITPYLLSASAIRRTPKRHPPSLLLFPLLSSVYPDNMSPVSKFCTTASGGGLATHHCPANKRHKSATVGVRFRSNRQLWCDCE